MLLKSTRDRISSLNVICKRSALNTLDHPKYRRLLKSFEMPPLQAAIFNSVKRRVMRQNDPIASLLLQCLMCREVILNNVNYSDHCLMVLFNIEFEQIETLSTYNHNLEPENLKVAFGKYPNLKRINVFLTNLEEDVMQELSLVHTLEEIRFGVAKSFIDRSNSFYCRLFFKGKTIFEVENCYKTCDKVTISFPHLKHLALPITNSKFKPFLKLFLHFYPETHIETIEEMAMTPVSPFDSYLAHTIDMFPEHALKNCNLRYEDLRFPYTVEIVTKWVNMKMLSIIIGEYTVDVDIKICSLRFAAIMKNSKNLDNLHLILSTEKAEPYYNSLLESLLLYGKRLRKFSIIDRCSFMAHQKLVPLINSLPELESLLIIYKAQTEYSRNVQLNCLPNLKDLVVCMNANSPRDFKNKIWATIIADIVQKSPNLTSFITYFDDYFCDALSALKFPHTLEKLSLSFTILDEYHIDKMFEIIKGSSVKEFRIVSHLGIFSAFTHFLFISANKIFKNSALEISLETISNNGLRGQRNDCLEKIDNK